MLGPRGLAKGVGGKAAPRDRRGFARYQRGERLIVAPMRERCKVLDWRFLRVAEITMAADMPLLARLGDCEVTVADSPSRE